MDALKVPRVEMSENYVLAHDCLRGKGNPSPKKRSSCKGFSRASRKRMIEQCVKLGGATPLFITLTYPAEFTKDSRRWKSNFHTWTKRLVRKFPEYSGMWRLEPQKRGAPHYHVLVYAPYGKDPFIDKDWIATSWNKVVEGDLAHLRAGTNVQMAKNARQASVYVSKYCAKPSDMKELPSYWDEVGRWWGVINREKLPKIPSEELILHSGLEQKVIISVFKEIMKKRTIKRLMDKYQSGAGCEELSLQDAWDLANDVWDTFQEKQGGKFFTPTSLYMSGEEFVSELSEIWEREGDKYEKMMPSFVELVKAYRKTSLDNVTPES